VSRRSDRRLEHLVRERTIMLARLRKRIDEKEEGFTLIELLVVIIIIGILAAIAIPVFLSQKTKGYEASMKSDLRTVAQDIESQNTDVQDYTKVNFGAGTGVLAVAASITGTGQSTVGGDSVTLSAGNTITVIGLSSGAFCLQASSSKSGASPFFYTSDHGGLLAKGSSCTATNI
jgi:type IV pilus assembly protein PilA